MPWRGTSDPYSVLVSEIMLQQTQVETVIPYFNRFIEKFPDFQSLADADEEEVFSLWAGLGYYRRARNLHACAKTIVDQYNGRFPCEKKAVLDLPGIGPYTAGAVLSIALNQSEPLVDGNVERVLSRVFTIQEDLATTAGNKKVWDIASQLVSNHAPGCFNQALMELGATLCKPTSPYCANCPIVPLCSAHKNGAEEAYPLKSKKRKAVKLKEVLLLVKMGGEWLLTNRNEESIYSGLWQFPWLWVANNENDLTSTLKSLKRQLELATENEPVPMMTTRHSVTHRRIETHCYLLELENPPHRSAFSRESTKLTPQSELTKVPLPSYQKKIIPLICTV